MKARRSWCAFVAVSLTIGCSGASDCTEAGCFSAAFVQYSNPLPIAALPLEVTTCAADTCNTQLITMGLVNSGQATIVVRGNVNLSGAGERSIDVNFAVKSQATGEVLASASGIGHTKKIQPNGAECGPTCYIAMLTYDGSAQLSG